MRPVMNSSLVMELILGSCTAQRPYWEHEFHLFEFIPVEWRWEVDDANLRQIVSSLKDPRDALWLDIFPEGRDYIHFPNEGTEKEFNTMKCLINCSAVIVFTVDMFLCRAMYIRVMYSLLGMELILDR
ncbi:hypothetical protein Bca52824_037563 [Brassica carinata]|uniref:Uncharacterized protein n=1 Tax=Brassica carinata TaxID=52824 RepID=A0A8X7UU46_BRACI|nr:hypothetical protein Bca52824_037563 [Brassica carinata]